VYLFLRLFDLKIELLKRYVLLTVGLFIISLGVSLSIKANLGTSPISCVPYVLSLGFPLSVGFFTFAVNAIMFLAQLLMLRNKFRPVQFLQLPAVALFSLFLDISLQLVSGLEPGHLLSQWLLLASSCLIIAFGVSLEIIAHVTMLPADGFVIALARVLDLEFRRVKICFDLSQVIIGILLSFYFLGRLEGIREGTIAASLSMGWLIRYFLTRNEFLAAMLGSRMQQDSC
jgi:uncharacterized membrane protein YczE